MQSFHEQKCQRNDQSGLQHFLCKLSDKHIRVHFKYFKTKTHVQTARESHDLNMDFRSFDNGFKQLCVVNFMQEYLDNIPFPI